MVSQSPNSNSFAPKSEMSQQQKIDTEFNRLNMMTKQHSPYFNINIQAPYGPYSGSTKETAFLGNKPNDYGNIRSAYQIPGDQYSNIYPALPQPVRPQAFNIQ